MAGTAAIPCDKEWAITIPTPSSNLTAEAVELRAGLSAIATGAISRLADAAPEFASYCRPTGDIVIRQTA